MIHQQDREASQEILNWALNFLDNNDELNVLPDIEPGQIYSKQDKTPPPQGKALEEVFREFQKDILPGITHWNHPGFMAYFNSSSTLPSVMADILSATMNSNSMLWKSNPAGTEIEQKVLDWFQQMIGLSGFTGITYDGGATSSFHGLAAMREKKLGPDYRQKGLLGLANCQPKIYLTEQTHNSIHKAIITLGFGTDSFRYVNINKDFTMNINHLAELIQEDRQNGFTPMCVVATLGTTSCTAIDPVEEISEICKKENLWLHIDAAHGGCAAILPEIREQYSGWENADSITVNPHKWLFIPIDLSILYVKEPETLKNAFRFSAEYLKTKQDNRTESYMDYGIPLGRRFRCLKLWFALKYHGVEFYKKRFQEHFELANLFYDAIKNNPDFEIMAPKPLTTTCFRAIPASTTDIDKYNEKLMDMINETGKYFISHTKLNGAFVLRHVVSGVRIQKPHIDEFIECLVESKHQLDNKVYN